MRNHKKLNIEASLTRSINQAPSLDFEKLAAIPVVKMTAHDSITRQQLANVPTQGRQRYFKPLSIAMAGALVMLVCVTTWFAEFKSPESIIALDANQSVEIVTNKHKQILSVKAFDQEDQTLLDEENLDQTNLEDSVGVIITAMIKNGYLDENSSVVMVTVENQSTAKADDLAATLNQVIKDSATAENIAATVVRQTVIPDSQAVTEAEQYSVSTGKLNVMKELVVADSSLSLESLASLSLTDLLAVSKEKAVDLTKVITVDESQKETKDLGTPTAPTEETPVMTAPVTTTEPATESNNKTKTPQPIDPVVIEIPEVVIEEPPTPEEPEVTPPEKETEAIDEEKKPLSENDPIVPEKPTEEPTEELLK
ncbi:hypothetical protein GH811_06645 [Acetobacterium malicum]|uniref:Anti-sigma factor RsgI-like middle domain-containing protein n=1 Tax=Acetobacterium malicum TaxID=52692 RepID=A0ABR6YVR5_9FIRM|nr:hypothetical protein [Acetobacterium malicum]MBC3899289.1 hypothetical protein [Acetobacterium malicum]